MAGTPAKAAAAKADPRTPDTDADKDAPDTSPATVGAGPVDRDPRAFGTIDTAGVAEAEKAGPGAVDPVRVESVTGPKNTTFAERAAARKKVVTGEDEGTVQK